MGKILVVDDDPTLHDIIEAALTEDGHLLRHASDAQRGLAIPNAQVTPSKEEQEFAVSPYLRQAGADAPATRPYQEEGFGGGLGKRVG